LLDVIAELAKRHIDYAAFTRAIDVPFKGSSMRVIGREDFIAMKVFAGGPQDLVDASNAIDIDPESLDQSLMQRLAKRYGKSAASALEKLLAEKTP
jgi:hypothetical protein